jgi:vitamin B12/bleomycin/antimicrobial peptide transport system ATP-binding/permease protein
VDHNFTSSDSPGPAAPDPDAEGPATPDAAGWSWKANSLLALRFWRSASGFWRAPSAIGAWIVTVALVGGTLLELALGFRLNYWNRDFFDAFGRRDGSALREQALLFLVLAGISITLAVLAVWSRMTMQRKWREWLTRYLIDRWLAGDQFHKLRSLRNEDRNPEFRIAEDARVATDSPVSMAVGLLSAMLNVVIFISILWNVGGDLKLEALGMAVTVPKYLVITVVAYSSLLTFTMTVIGRYMVPVIARKNAAEAQFRSIASNLRERAESAMPAADAAAPHRQVSEAFDVVIARWRDICVQFMRITVVANGNSLAAPIVGWFLCAPKYLAGTMSLGEAAQAVAAFVTVQAALNWLVDNYGALAECLSSVNRVALLLLALDEAEGE